MLVQVENLLARSAVQLGVLADVLVEALQIGETLLLGDHQHLGVDIVHLLQAHLVDLLRLKPGGGHAPDGVLIAGIAVGQ